MSKNRSCINIGEAGALFIISKEKSHLAIKGFGESSDAHHHSAPHPEGNGAYSSMKKAMEMAQLGPTELDYLNLHGTGTKQNDSMEAKAVDRLKLTNVACSSTKSLTGHTLGAAGAIEAAFCCLGIEERQIPVQNWDNAKDNSLPGINIISTPKEKSICNAMTNSFAFGGNNCSLIIGKSHA